MAIDIKNKNRMGIEMNAQFKQALKLMQAKTGNVFVTGRAGTGKSTLLQYFRQHTRKKIVVLAPTGVAALNVGGQTIHSFFGFRPDVTLASVKRQYVPEKQKNLIRKIDAIVIDEISMVRADLMDCIDLFLRLHGPQKVRSFGGVQMIFIGDLYQLPPVTTSKDEEAITRVYTTPYFFSANAFNQIELELIELEKIYRQHDEKFIAILNAIRNRTVSDEHLRELNKRCQPNFQPKMNELYVILTPRNDSARCVNEEQIARIRERARVFVGEVWGRIEERDLPTDRELKLKRGAQVMFVANDRGGRWVNGTMGKVIDFDEDEETIFVELQERKKIVEVTPYQWDMYQYRYNAKTGGIEAEIGGSFIQYPLRLAWAITVHKSQGKTFDRVILDLTGGMFAYGQTYVALSRCRTLEGLVLKSPLKLGHIRLDWRVPRFLTDFQYKKAENNLSVENKLSLIGQVIREKRKVHFTYLKRQDEKSERMVEPWEVGEMEYEGKKYIGMRGYCFMRKEERVFRLDRMLSLNII